MELALYFLIIKVGYGMVVMPEKYPIDQCSKISKDFEQGQAYCVVAPQQVKCVSDNSIYGGTIVPIPCRYFTGKP